jgi:hypothetical protein
MSLFKLKLSRLPREPPGRGDRERLAAVEKGVAIPPLEQANLLAFSRNSGAVQKSNAPNRGMVRSVHPL